MNYYQLILSIDLNTGPHVAVFYAFLELLIDIPFAVLFMFIILFHWRFIIYRKKVAKVSSKQYVNVIVYLSPLYSFNRIGDAAFSYQNKPLSYSWTFPALSFLS